MGTTMKRASCSLIFVLLANCLGYAGGTAVRAMYASRPDAPLQATGITNNFHDLAAAIHFKNVSGLNIVSFQVGWVTAVAKDCSASALMPILQFAPVEEVNILPGASYTSESYKVGAGATWILAKQLKAEHLSLQFGVVAVTFADGTDWKFDLAKARSFDEGASLKEFACGEAFDNAVPTTCGEPGTLNLPRLEAKALGISAMPLQLWECYPTDNYTECTRIYHPAPGCKQDDIGRCCYTTVNQPPRPFQYCVLK